MEDERLRTNSETCLFEKNLKVVWSSALRLEKQQQHFDASSKWLSFFEALHQKISVKAMAPLS